MRQNKLLSLLRFGLFFILVIFTTPSTGCSCQPQHPQTAYCNADYVIIARILRKTTVSKPQFNTYKIDIKKAYKMSEKAMYYLKEGRIMTPKSDMSCGATLEIGRIYVIAGRGSHINLCNYVKPYRDMSTVERRGFAGFYRKGCDCQVSPCFSNNPADCFDQRDDTCFWKPFGQCETKYSVCVPRGRVSRCHWRYTPAYKECIRTP